MNRTIICKHWSGRGFPSAQLDFRDRWHQPPSLPCYSARQWQIRTYADQVSSHGRTETRRRAKAIRFLRRMLENVRRVKYGLWPRYVAGWSDVAFRVHCEWYILTRFKALEAGLLTFACGLLIVLVSMLVSPALISLSGIFLCNHDMARYCGNSSPSSTYQPHELGTQCHTRFLRSVSPGEDKNGSTTVN